jgi:Xaa-Pro aminopeptidase
MSRELSELEETLADADTGGFLFHGHEIANQYYLSGFDAPDPFVSLYADGGTHLLVSGLEYGRAQSESQAETVTRMAEYDARQLQSEYGRVEGTARMITAFLDEHGVDSVLVPTDFPAGTADGLREQDIEVSIDEDDVIAEIRAVKTDTEVEHIQRAQRANEAAMERAETLLREAIVEDGQLYHDDEVLTSERVSQEIEITLLRHGCALDETIVASGADAADPHNRGSGPIEANVPIVVDIFPQDKESRYHADMTRTFCKGEPEETAREWYDLTAEAKAAAFDVLEAGVTGSDVHDAVCDVYEDAGLPTLRSDGSAETGFIHGTGHGIGLEVHESPTVSPTGDTELEPGHVVTIEPGLYDPDVGGIRIEDLVVVTEDGFNNLTHYHHPFVLP